MWDFLWNKIKFTIMKKVLTIVILPIIILGLVYLIVTSVMKPVNFQKEQKHREAVGIERLKDIRTLQEAYKSTYDRFAESIDTLKDFYRNGNIKIIKQVGSMDDSAAVAHTEAVRKRNPKITSEQLQAMYDNGDKDLVFRIETDIPVRDTLFNNRPNFNIDSLAFIPFSGDSIIMQAVISKVSGVDVPLFEACMPYKSLLKGMDNQLRINLDADRKDTGKYPGLMVGSITSPNNNAGNWE